MRWTIILIALWAGLGAEVSGANVDVIFGPVRVGDEAVDTVLVRNTDALDLLVMSDGVEGTAYDLPGEPFSGGPVLLKPEEALQVLVRFAPPDTGRFVGGLDVSAGDTMWRFELRGEGKREVIVINEFLADPAPGEAGDANGDGARDTYEDEFVELLNTGRRPLDVGGMQLSDAGTAVDRRFTFPPGTRIGPGERVVLFGGGMPRDVEGHVFVDDGRIGGGLSNSGDAVFLIDPAGPDTLARAVYGSEGNGDQALVRYPEGVGAFTGHGELPGTGSLFSPGRSRVVLDRLLVELADTVTALGQAMGFAVVGVFEDGSTQTLTGEASVATSDALVLSVEEDSLRALGVGGACVSAQVVGFLSEPACVRVLAPAIQELAVSPPDTLSVVGDSVAFEVRAVYPDGSRQPVAGGITWMSSDDSRVRPASPPWFFCVAPGVVTLSAVLEDAGGSAVVRVADAGDLNADGVYDILDAVRLVQVILDESGSLFELRAGDLNRDRAVDVLDLALVINRILGRPPGSPRVAPPGVATWVQTGTILQVRSPAALRALLLEVKGEVEDVRVDGLEGARVVVRGGRILIYRLSGDGDSSQRTFRVRAQAGEPVAVVRIQGADVFGREVAFVNLENVPERPVLSPNFPNPFNSNTVLDYGLPEERRVVLRIFSSLGQEVARLVDGRMPPGFHRAAWDGRDAAGREAGSGIYLGCLDAGPHRAVIKMMLLR